MTRGVVNRQGVGGCAEAPRMEARDGGIPSRRGFLSLPSDLHRRPFPFIPVLNDDILIVFRLPDLNPLTSVSQLRTESVLPIKATGPQ